MAKAKGTGKSSYDQICCRLAATTGYGRVRAIILQALQAAHIDKIVPENSYQKFPNGRRPHGFQIDFGNERQNRLVLAIKQDDKQVVLNTFYGLDQFFSVPDVETEILPFFGTKACPTYFCKRDQVLTKMVDFVKREIGKDAEIVEATHAAEARILQQARELYADGAVERAVQDWYDDEAVKEIRNALLRFKDLRAEVIKRALDEYVVHDIMQS